MLKQCVLEFSLLSESKTYMYMVSFLNNKNERKLGIRLCSSSCSWTPWQPSGVCRLQAENRI